ncbi:MAG: T9SS type A sorting domain-containing protein [Bacteroidetes bacterium]|nr:T9SS type A sorting domain-containing protein [Bacteroidota bacterium]
MHRTIQPILAMLTIILFNAAHVAAQLPSEAWQIALGGFSYDNPQRIITTKNGDCILAGKSKSGNTGDKSDPNKTEDDIWIVRIDKYGKKIWDKSFGTTENTLVLAINCISETADGGILIGMTSTASPGLDKTAPNKGSGDMWLLKLDKDGKKLWDKSYGGNDGDGVSKILPHKNGGYFLFGNSFSQPSGDRTTPYLGSSTRGDLWIVKIDEAGNKLWDTAYISGNNQETFGDAILTSDGRYAIVTTTFFNDWKLDLVLTFLNDEGHRLSFHPFGGSENEQAFGIAEMENGFLLAASTTSQGGSGDVTDSMKGGKVYQDVWLVKTDLNGKLLWNKRYGTSSADLAVCMEAVPGNNAVIGVNFPASTGAPDIDNDKSCATRGKTDGWILFVDSAGNLKDDKCWGTTEFDNISDIATWSDSSVTVLASSNGGINNDRTAASKGESDFWVTRFGKPADPVSAKDLNLVFSVYPNPCSSIIHVDVPLNSSFNLYDLNGKLHLEGWLTTGNSTIDISHLHPGFYTLKLNSEEQWGMHKIVKPE